MAAKAQRQKRREFILSSLNVAIEASNLAKEFCSITPAQPVFATFSIIFTMIKESMTNEEDCVELGLACADVCTALSRGLDGKMMKDLNNSVCEAINRLTTTLAEIQKKIVEKRKRNAVSRFFHAKNDKASIATWQTDLTRILRIFNTELAINTNVTVTVMRNDVTNTHTMVSDMHQIMTTIQRGAGGNNHPARASVSGESPPSPPGVFFGRDELIEKIIGFAEHPTPIALIGAGGIGKTSIALTVLQDDRIKQRFGDDRRFIRCDKFTASLPNFLARLSKVIGAGIGNPEDLTPLRPFLSSKKMVIVLDNAESILDPEGKHVQEIYAAVEELSQFENIWLCITSRITTVPSNCEILKIPTLSAEAAHDTFYRIYKHGERSQPVSDILEQLDFHPLSITLLATVAQHSEWSTGRLTKEWEKRRTGVLNTKHKGSLGDTIELSLASLMFQELGPDARDLLGVVAFFPQGVDENNLDWLFPTTSNRSEIFDTFCILSLTYRSNGFITMLAPLRDHLFPKDPKLSPLLSTTKEHYFHRLSADICPGKPGFDEALWVISEDVNVEHLLNIFTSIDANSDEVWTACYHFVEHLTWHRRRLIVLGSKIEALPDDHPAKAKCFFWLGRLFDEVGKFTESKRLYTHTLGLFRAQGDDYWVAETLWGMSSSNRMLGLCKEGTEQLEEARKIYERLGNALGQARSLCQLAHSLYGDKQLDAAEAAASQVIDRFPDEKFEVCECHHVLGDVYHAKGETEKAIHHLEAALKIASSFSWEYQLLWIHHSLADLAFNGGRFDDAHAHIELAKSHAVNDAYGLGRTEERQAWYWYLLQDFKEAKSTVLHAAEVYQRVGATKDVEDCKDLLQKIEDASKGEA